MRAYGETGSPRDYQEDHLISLELGGDPVDPRNLWPEPNPRATEVDKLENELNAKVCSGELTLIEAQGPRLIKEFELRAYTCAELTALLARHGLEVRSVWGGPDHSEYAAESRRLVLLATRMP